MCIFAICPHTIKKYGMANWQQTCLVYQKLFVEAKLAVPILQRVKLLSFHFKLYSSIAFHIHSVSKRKKLQIIRQLVIMLIEMI